MYVLFAIACGIVLIRLLISMFNATYGEAMKNMENIFYISRGVFIYRAECKLTRLLRYLDRCGCGKSLRSRLWIGPLEPYKEHAMTVQQDITDSVPVRPRHMASRQMPSVDVEENRQVRAHEDFASTRKLSVRASSQGNAENKDQIKPNPTNVAANETGMVSMMVSNADNMTLQI